MMVAQKSKTKKSQKQEGIESLRDKLSGNELKAAAYARCQEDLIKLFRKNANDLKVAEDLQRRLNDLQEKVEAVRTKEKEVVQKWLSDFSDLSSLIATDVMRADLQKRAAQSAQAGQESASGKRLGIADMIQLLEAAQADSNGMVLFSKELQSKWKSQSIDVLTKKLKCVSGEVYAVKDGGQDSAAKINSDHKIEKTKGTRSQYRLDVKKILARLKTEVKKS